MTTYLILSIIVASAATVAVAAIIARWRHVSIVHEGFVCLLYHEGKLTRTLSAGRHVLWGRNFRLLPVDNRKTLLNVQGQEVLTADNIGVKISLALTTQIIDAVKTVQTVDNYATHLYSAAQNALRVATAEIAIDALLAQRAEISTRLREIVEPQAAAFGVQLHAVEVKDVMLPAELRRAFNETLKARQEGQAAVERARGESAALRNLANAARLVESQPALATLRMLQTLETSKQTIVLNDLSLLASPRSVDKT
jgi:regulator of protease activity HflC (stomatin/prohibitin superfamily)